MSPTMAMPWPGRSRSAERATARTTTMTGPGTGRRSARAACSTANIAAASASEGQWIVAGLADEVDEGGDQAVGRRAGAPVTRLSWPMMIESEMPAKKPTRIGRDRKVERTPRPRSARRRGRSRRRSSASMAATRGAVGVGEAGHGGEDGGHDGDRRGVGADDQLARRAEDGVGDERRDRGVEAGLRRQAGDRRIGDGAGQARPRRWRGRRRRRP